MTLHLMFFSSEPEVDVYVNDRTLVPVEYRMELYTLRRYSSSTIAEFFVQSIYRTLTEKPISVFFKSILEGHPTTDKWR